MTAVNHIMTGALLAATIRQPVLAVPLAFLSHFVLDALPHFGVAAKSIAERNKNWLFRTVLSLDVVLTAATIVLLPMYFMVKVSVGLLLACMTAAWLPDLAWIRCFLRELRTNIRVPEKGFSWFHAAIQRYERPWGLAVEVAWFSGIGMGLYYVL